jgi:hypothetical protein
MTENRRTRGPLAQTQVLTGRVDRAFDFACEAGHLKFVQ